jgi:hypothetical protein
MTRPFKMLATFFALLALSPSAFAAKICVYDPAGRTGDAFRVLEAWATEASAWGEEVTLTPYTDEETATKDYEARQCDGVVATGVRLQRFNRFPSTLEAVGGLPTYELLGQMVNTLSSSAGAAAKLVSGEHETVGFIPIGAVYLFVRDRNIDSVAELAGKRIATLEYDKPSVTMVDRVGAIMVPADLGSIGPKFNNGDVDACYASAPAYQPFELWRGLGEKGGIIRYPLAQATLQVMLRHEAFPEGFTAKARTDLAARLDDSLATVRRAEAAIPEKYWVDLPESYDADFQEMFQHVRIRLRDDVGSYDGAMLGVMRKLRCAANGDRAECAEKKE